MEMLTGTIRIPASKEAVWEALIDPEVLKQCIPGCQSLTKISDLEFEATVVIRIGPVSASFTGSFALENPNPPHECTIVGTAQGGPAGFVEGRVLVQITEIEEKVSSLNYTAQAQIGGKLMQIGSRLIHSSAKKLSDEFFQRLNRILSKSSAPRSSPILQKRTGLGRSEYPEYLDRQFLLVVAGGILLSWLYFFLLAHGADPQSIKLERLLIDLEARVTHLEDSSGGFGSLIGEQGATGATGSESITSGAVVP